MSKERRSGEQERINHTCHKSRRRHYLVVGRRPTRRTVWDKQEHGSMGYTCLKMSQWSTFLYIQPRIKLLKTVRASLLVECLSCKAWTMFDPRTHINNLAVVAWVCILAVGKLRQEDTCVSLASQLSSSRPSGQYLSSDTQGCLLDPHKITCTTQMCTHTKI